MDDNVQELLQGQCERCKRAIAFPSVQEGKKGICPHCKNETILNTNTASQKLKLPPWVLTTTAILSITVVLSFVVCETLISNLRALAPMALEQISTGFHIALFCNIFFIVAAYVLGIGFLIYIFTSLKEMRATIKQIEMNTRAPREQNKPSEPMRESSWPTTQKPYIPPEDAKYLPKG